MVTPNKFRPAPPDIPPGIAPDLGDGPAFQALHNVMQAQRAEEGMRPTADGTRLRGSMAGDCNRKVAFQALGVEPTIALETETLVTFSIGQTYHERIQEALAKEFEAELEVTCTYKEHGIDMSGHADAVYRIGASKTVVEIKSMKSFAFELAVNGNRFDRYGPGPKPEHLMQAGIYALAPNIQAAWVHMIYINKDTGAMAEWIIGVDEQLTHLGKPDRTIREMVSRELARLTEVLTILDLGNMPERVVPGYGTVNHLPPEANSKNKPWACRYCGWRDLCAEQPYTEFPLSDT